ncbi:peptide chain release factor N(5)-glutamine methyltransferase [Butyrivibrio sp. VCB2006]|uniref:peptide chain release factor N(5)-glutamine methyltransferase n=1 Tax=Butyrivibrio sp. VCB2006 TaxID=1280679 RepID=UPI0003F58F02|nr:peptide chain release factor N(5)-glutamine methyltransferase [Butyrivibrio sp. VCB2006]
MSNYRDIYLTGSENLKKAGITEAMLDARLLLECACGTDHNTLLAHPDRKVTAEEEDRYLAMIDRRAKREPVAYIIGSWSFMGLDFKVDKNVLIPEQDTETLVEEVMRFQEDGMRIMDLCTGSGCIALSLLNYSNNTTAVCTDISAGALEVARSNAKGLGLSDRAIFVETDLFPDEDMGKFDIIVSNPPYIASSVIDSLAPEVKEYEPRLALDGAEDGLVFYRRIVETTPRFLNSNGYLFLEIGYDQGQALVEMLEDKKVYHDIQVIKDLGGNDRVVSACFY